MAQQIVVTWNRYLAIKTYLVGREAKRGIKKFFGLDKKAYRFHSVETPVTRYYRKNFIDTYGFQAFGEQTWNMKYRKNAISWMVFIIVFGLSAFLTALQQNKEYYRYLCVEVPTVMKWHDTVIRSLSQFQKRFLPFLTPNDITQKHNYNAMLEDTRQQLLRTKERREKRDRKAVQLREQLKEVDKKLSQFVKQTEE